MLDIKVALETIGLISKWVANILAERRSEQEKKDAQLLAETGKLLISLRALDNTIHSLVGQLTLFDLDWPLTRRNELIAEINDFAHREEIITIIRQVLRQLPQLWAGAKEEDWKLSLEIYGCGTDLLRTLSDSPVTPFPDTDALREFAMRIKKAENQADVEAVIAKSEVILNILDRKRLAAADEVFGRMKGQILARHPKLPNPNWGYKDHQL